MKKTLTIFTPTYNRADTLRRVYESLCTQTSDDFEWLVVDDGSTDFTRQLVEGFIRAGRVPVRYIYKENGGLYTGYNTAYENITTELSVCIDSDDFMPDDAVESIITLWREKGNERYCGIVGLDIDFRTMQPIGGQFPATLSECYFMDLRLKKLHSGDTKLVMRTDLMKQVAPQTGFPGEKNFNPIYMILKVCDKYPLLVINKGLCIVDYQDDGMSRNIFNQYITAPRSFSKLRLLEMQLKHNSLSNRIRCCIHYTATCRIARDGDWLKNSPRKLLTLMCAPAGLLLHRYLLYKAGH